MTGEDINSLIDRLQTEHRLDSDGYAALLTCGDDTAERLRATARQVAQTSFGRGVYIRGLVELTNVCRNDCHYCGLRRGNAALRRYTLSGEQVLSRCEMGYNAGFRTFVLQGGELSRDRAEWVAGLVAEMRACWPDVAITLSLGEWPRETYAMWRRAGADRYLLRHEARNAGLYASIHPTEMSIENRLHCLESLKELGYQTGTGIMVGLPGQTVAHLVEDIEYIEQQKPQMIGLGPFVPQHDTPLAHCPAGSVDTTTRLYAIFRLMFPQALIPSTTALNTIHPQGRLLGVLAGANVVMPNLSPPEVRGLYTLYDGKAATAAEAAEGLAQLEAQLATIGYHVDYGRGDHPSHSK